MLWNLGLTTNASMKTAALGIGTTSKGGSSRMGMRALESAILYELREKEQKRSIKLKDIAWALGDTLPEGYERPGDKVVHLTIYGNQPVTVAYAPATKKAK